MSKDGLKRVLGILLLVAGGAVAGAGLVLLGRGIGYFGSGADPATAFHEIDAHSTAAAAHAWLEDAAGLPREMEDATRDAVGRSYAGAWETLRRHHNGEKVALSTYFTGPGLDAVTADTPLSDAAIFDRAHQLRIEFYAADGQIVQLTDTAQVGRAYRTQRGDSVLIESEETYIVVLLLEDGNWRVRHWLRTSGAS